MPESSSEVSIHRWKLLRSFLLAVFVLLAAAGLLVIALQAPAVSASVPADTTIATVNIVQVWTADGNGNFKTAFNRGDAVRYRVNVENQSSVTVTAPFTWSVSGPCGSANLWTGNLAIGPGGSSWSLPASIAADACPGTYTFSVSVIHDGQTSSKSATYTVLGATTGAVRVISAWTADANNNFKTAFNPGDAIRYRANVDNGTGVTVTVPFTWSVNGPCGSTTLWTGNLDVPPAGSSFTLTGTVASDACPGAYTFNVSLQHNGQVSSQSAPYTVAGATGGALTVLQAWTTNADGAFDTSFSRGEAVRYRANIDNQSGVTVTAPFTWSVSGPCGSAILFAGDLSVGPGGSSWSLPASIAGDACPGTYTFAVSLTHGGQTSSRTSTYTVLPPAPSTVQVISAWTADANNNFKTAFNPGDAIRYRGNVENTTGVTATVPFTWSVSGPCGSATLWTGNLAVPPAGSSWTLPGSISTSACPGTYTYSLSLLHNGQVSSRTAQYTVSGATAEAVSVSWAWTADRGGAKRTSYAPGEQVRYYANLYNRTGGAATVGVEWKLNGPCGSTVLWSGNLDTGSQLWNWSLPAILPTDACPGNYTYEFTVVHGGDSSSRSVPLSVYDQNVDPNYFIFLPMGNGPSGEMARAAVIAANGPSGAPATGKPALTGAPGPDTGTGLPTLVNVFGKPEALDADALAKAMDMAVVDISGAPVWGPMEFSPVPVSLSGDRAPAIILGDPEQVPWEE